MTSRLVLTDLFIYTRAAGCSGPLVSAASNASSQHPQSRLGWMSEREYNQTSGVLGTIEMEYHGMEDIM